ncbi:MAG: RtcB family protein [Hyphomicrobiales bacterium]|nr:RtcB family protein [Hyphomicrobiales bacterium]
MTTITGKTLMGWGVKPGPWFASAIEAAREAIAKGLGEDAAKAAALSRAPAPVEMRALRGRDAVGFHVNAVPDTDEERSNIAAVETHMRELMRVPTIVSGAVMPDACPSDVRPGTIPVGGVVATKDAIHPGMHSADICCSVAVTIFGRHVDPTALLDAGMKLSHFGGGGRPRGAQHKPSADILERFAGNRLLAPLVSVAQEHFATQGDGNHFFYVGRVRSTGDIALVTHHGSRAPGAKLYKAGMALAEAHRRAVSPETPAHNAWIPADTDDGRDYWEALQIVRAWTKANHFAIHNEVGASVPHGAGAIDRFWNEHNFVFRKSDGLFYHAKGATPAWSDFAADTNGLTMIPLNMAEPILIVRGKDAPHALGFSPHGAGRNLSRTAYLRANAGRPDAEMIAEQAPGIDVRYFCGVPDLSELPGAYKNAASVRSQIERFGLAEIVDQIDPIGNIMAGDWQRDAPWRKKRDTLPAPQSDAR